MLLPEIKEREYRFRLALRMGLPIFGLILAFISSTFITTYESLQPTFYFSSILLLVFSIYFIFFLIYKGFDEKITETVSKTFTRDYLYKFLKTKIDKEYTLILFSVNNLHDINTRYGIKNGDKVLYEFVHYIAKYLEDKEINNFPIGHIKGGDFIIGLDGKKEDYNTLVELLCLKSSELKIKDIEVNISGAITDTHFSNNLDYMIESLFEIQEENKTKRNSVKRDLISPNDLESYIINAIQKELVVINIQEVYENSKVIMQEYFIKLEDTKGKLLHPKSYLKVVNKLGLTVEYDILILKKSVEQYLKFNEGMFCITVHPTSLRNNVFLEKVKTLLEENPSIKENIVFIMSEKEYYSNIDKFNYTLQTLRKNGVKIAIDKLGSLQTSFLYLRDLEVDIVRFDSLYTKEIDKEKYSSVLNGFNLMAHSRGVKTWMKMLESKEVKDKVKSLDIDYKQGKILSKLKQMEQK